MANKWIFYGIGTKEFIRKKSTDNTRALTAPSSNKQWSYLFKSAYISIQEYSMLLFFQNLKKYGRVVTIWHTIIFHAKCLMIQGDRLIESKCNMNICISFGNWLRYRYEKLIFIYNIYL